MTETNPPRSALSSRRAFLSALGGVLASPLEAAGSANVLLIISDQFHHAALGAAGHPVVKTPNIDGLARQGVRFSHAVCATPFCSPTRASLLTALYPHKHGITYNVREGAGAGDRGLDTRLPSTEQALHQIGYACGQKGKWHLGDKTRLAAYASDPELSYQEYLARAMPSAAGARRRARSTITSTEAVRRALAQFDERGISIGRTDLPVEHAQESWIADTAIRQLETFRGRPFFMTVSFPAPHAPWVAAEPYYSMYERARIPLAENRRAVEPVDRSTAAWRFGQLLGEEGFREYLGVYYGMVSMVDWNVGRVLEALRRLGAERDTLVIFTSDHGDMQGGHGMYGKTNYSIYEETTRVPLVMRFPGRMPAGKLVGTQAGSCDLQPTILDYLGIAAPAGIHGRSLRPFIDGREDLERPIFCERERGKQHFQRMIRTLAWKYVYCSSGESQLYHLEKDPGETRNLIGEAAARDVKRKLHGDLSAWMKQTGDARAAVLPAAV